MAMVPDPKIRLFVFVEKSFRHVDPNFWEVCKLYEMASERSSEGMDTVNRLEISIRIQWRWSRTPKSVFFGGGTYINSRYTTRGGSDVSLPARSFVPVEYGLMGTHSGPVQAHPQR